MLGSDKIFFNAEGTNFDIPINNYDFENTSQLDNKEVHFGIRPEHINYKKTNDTDFEVNLRADLKEYIGHEQIITFNYFSQEILGKFPSTVKIETGKEMKLFFDLSQISIFDKKTNKRI